MSRQSEARKQKRAVKALGAVFFDRSAVTPTSALKALAEGTKPLELVAYNIAAALVRLDEEGADIMTGHTVVTIGQHPEFPGQTTIEVKSATRKRPTPEGAPAAE